MKIIFKIEFKYENGYFLGRILNEEQIFKSEVDSDISVNTIKNIVSSKSLIGGDNQRTDLFIFCLKNTENSGKLTVGKIIKLV